MTGLGLERSAAHSELLAKTLTKMRTRAGKRFELSAVAVCAGEPPGAVVELAGRLGVPVRSIDAAAAGPRAAGEAAADELADSGYELAVPIAPPSALVGAAARIAIAVATGTEPVRLVANDLPVAEWTRQVVALRDGIRALPVGAAPAVLADLDPALAALTGFLAAAARRDTWLLVSGVAPVAAALLAAREGAPIGDWLVVADQLADPAQEVALGAFGLGVAPLLDLGFAPPRVAGDGASALAVLPLLVAALLLASSGDAG